MVMVIIYYYIRCYNIIIVCAIDFQTALRCELNKYCHEGSSNCDPILYDYMNI